MPTLSFRVDGYPAPYSSTATQSSRSAIAAKAQDESVSYEVLVKNVAQRFPQPSHKVACSCSIHILSYSGNATV
jgi:hypothetical protein